MPLVQLRHRLVQLRLAQCPLPSSYLSLPLVPVLLWVLENRFVIPEEDRLRRKFRAEFARYCQKTRRWV